jgi:membrane protein DedA with SNARE-associated domain
MNWLAVFGLNLLRVQGWFEAGGYLALFGLLFACGLGLPLPEDVPLLLAGVFIFHGKMQLAHAAILAWCGIIGGDCVLYNLGKRYGLNITMLPMVGKHVTPARIEQAERLYERYGIWVVAVGRLIAGVRGAMVVAAGATRFNFVKFIIADGLAALISGGIWIWLGYWGAMKVGDPATIMERAKPYKHWIGLGLLVVAAGLVLYLVWRHRRHTTIGEVLADKVEKRVTRDAPP